MNVAFYTAASGLFAYQHDIDVLANNMANVSTIGFKPSRVSFNDLLYTKMNINKEEPELAGHGVKAQNVDLLFGESVMNFTGYPLDFAISGNGFFAVQNERGETTYTRNGSFDISLSGQSGYLVDSVGNFVLDMSGRKIKLTAKNGSNEFDLSDLSSRIGVYTFSNPYGLESVGSSQFAATEKSGQAVSAAKSKNADYTLLSNALEFSSVDMADTMSDVMLSSRAYQFSAKMLQTSDEIEEIVNNLR